MNSAGKERDDLPREDLPQELIALLLQIAAGERQADDPSTRKELQRWPAHQSAVSDWLRTAEFARSAFSDDREIKRGSHMEKITEADRALARRALAPHLPTPKAATPPQAPSTQASAQATRPARSSLRQWLIAASMLILAGAGSFAWRKLGAPKQQLQPPIMLSQGMQLVAPLGQVPAFERFEWKGPELPLMGNYHLRVETQAGALLLEVNVPASEYTPSPEELERLRSAGRVKWMVETLDRAGRRVAWGSWQEAWLAGH